MRFGKLKKGDSFFYNGLRYSKSHDDKALNHHYGFFTINPNEEVTTINDDDDSILLRLKRFLKIGKA